MVDLRMGIVCYWGIGRATLDADIKLFHFFSRPWGFSQEGEAWFYAGVKPKTPDGDNAAQIFPSEMVNEFM